VVDGCIKRVATQQALDDARVGSCQQHHMSQGRAATLSA
jgi:hypothetical protein